MNKMTKLTFLVLCVGLFNACEDTPNASFVYGEVSIEGSVANYQGTLGESGDYDVYGKCELKGKNLNFDVGHAALSQLNKSPDKHPKFLSISGIKGPPVKGVFDLNSNVLEPDPKDNENLYTTFNVAVVKNEYDQWRVEPSNSDCDVELFATPREGEVIFEQNLNKSFDYYIRVNCGSITATGLEGDSLSGFKAELYFEGCS